MAMPKKNMRGDSAVDAFEALREYCKSEVDNVRNFSFR